jgi:Tat protein secretion system quality control protein TatD with DNase activity
MLIDTHCHLNDPLFEKSLPDVLTRAKAAGVSAFIVLASFLT